ncbi:MAG: NAD(P)/FAD-dependent oxidoreductase [Vicinamibacterales bacterium]
MIRTRYGVSPWFDAVPSSKRPQYAAYRGASSSPVVIIGGGMTGCMTAYACAAAGARVVLLEADRIGHGGSSRASGLFTGEASASFRDLEQSAGRRIARAAFDASRRASRDLAATVKRLGIKAGLELHDALRIVPPGMSDKAARREASERHEAGLEASWVSPAALARQTAIDGAGAMRLRDWGAADPVRLLLGFASAATRRGATFFEKSSVRRITFDRKQAVVILENGSITTPKVMVCTGEPTDLFRPLKRHFRFEERYVVITEPLSAAVRSQLGQRSSIICDTETPAHQLRWTDDHRVVFSGADQKRTPARQRERVLVQRTGQLMYELSRLYPAISGAIPTHGWDTPLAHAADDVMYAGPHRNFPHQFFAFGTLHDPARAFLASRILLRCALGETNRDNETFAFARNL